MLLMETGLHTMRTHISKTASAAGFSLLEILMAAIVFSLVSAGAIASVSALRQPVGTSKEELTAAFIGKQVLEELRNKVDATNWDGGAIDPTGGPAGDGVYDNLGTVTVDNVVYTPVYTVTTDPSTRARKVRLDVSW